jgi:FtsZ-binding cell division protein ZapB
MFVILHDCEDDTGPMVFKVGHWNPLGVWYTHETFEEQGQAETMCAWLNGAPSMGLTTALTRASQVLERTLAASAPPPTPPPVHDEPARPVPLPSPPVAPDPVARLAIEVEELREHKRVAIQTIKDREAAHEATRVELQAARREHEAKGQAISDALGRWRGTLTLVDAVKRLAKTCDDLMAGGEPIELLDKSDREALATWLRENP